MKEVPQFELEFHFKVHDNENGEMVKIGPDEDGLGCVEVIDSNITLIMPPDQALLVAEAIKRVALELKFKFQLELKSRE